MGAAQLVPEKGLDLLFGLDRAGQRHAAAQAEARLLAQLLGDLQAAGHLVDARVGAGDLGAGLRVRLVDLQVAGLEDLLAVGCDRLRGRVVVARRLEGHRLHHDLVAQFGVERGGQRFLVGLVQVRRRRVTAGHVDRAERVEGREDRRHGAVDLRVDPAFDEDLEAGLAVDLAVGGPVLRRLVGLRRPLDLHRDAGPALRRDRHPDAVLAEVRIRLPGRVPLVDVLPRRRPLQAGAGGAPGRLVPGSHDADVAGRHHGDAGRADQADRGDQTAGEGEPGVAGLREFAADGDEKGDDSYGSENEAEDEQR
jgi:hypothetical protein